jgi:hypothetical protein
MLDVGSLLATGLSLLVSLLPLVPPGYGPANADPVMTASASAPITVTVIRYNPVGLTTPAPLGEHMGYVITATDKDTFANVVGGVTDLLQSPDYSLQCIEQRLYYPTVAKPVLRGTSPDGTSTWDVSGFGLSVPNNVPVTESVQVNTYTITNPLVAAAVTDMAVIVNQSIKIPRSYP